MKWSDLSFKEKKQIYDSIKAQNPDTTYLDIKSQFDSIPAYEDGGKRIVDYVNSNNVNFVNRLKNPFRQTINDWETQYINKYVPNVNDKFELVYNSKATHKLSAWEGEEGRGLIVPNVQEINGKLVDFTRPPYNNREALRQAFKTGDFVETDTYNDAEWYTQNYKKYYPSFEDGGKKVTPPKELGLTPGTPEYYKRQQQISGKASTVQPEAYITPAGYVKDAINFVEDLSNGDYTGAAVDAALNIIPWGVGKTLKKFKSKVGRLIEGTDEYATSSYAEPFTPTITKPTKVKRTPSGERNYNPAKPPKDIEAQAAMLQDTWYREAVNKNQYSNEILRSVDQALYPDEDTRKLVREIDKAYNTNYEKAYSDIAYKEITGRKDYVSYGSMGDNIYGKANMKNIQDGFTSSNVDDYSIVLDPSTYIPGTANHELGHIADGIAGSIKYEAEPGVDYITNPYLRYLADPSNTYTTKELRDAGFHSAAKNKRYLLNPTESKSHMLTLKRALKDSNKISKWSDPVDENMILDYFRSGKANGAVRNQYDLYIDKQRYIDRLNRLVPMEWLLPTIGLGGAEFLREKQNNKSN